jgi:diacylglycerol O-acyltransferase
MPREPLSSVDTAWLRMEEPTNMMMITGTMIFGAPIDWKRLRATLENRLLCFDRFRQRVVMPRSPLGTPYWEDDPRFDLDWHLKRAALPPPVNQIALENAVSALMSVQLDFSRPLWQIHLIERYGKGSALIVRLHHCIADGIALVHVLLSLTDKSPNTPWANASHQAAPSANPQGTFSRPVHPAFQLTQTLWRESKAALDDPDRLRELTRLGTEGALALGRFVFRSPDPKTLFKGELGLAKRAVWSKPIPLQNVKTVGRIASSTVNDVLLAAVAGALGSYMRDHGEIADGIKIRAIVPVNLRPLDSEPDLGNKFGLVFLTLPIGIEDPVERLREVKRCMDEIKSTPESAVVFGLLSVMGVAPAEIQDIAMDIFGAKGTAVITNVPGPKEQLYLAGAPLETIMFWVPQSGHLGLGVCILSYAGQVRLGIATDAGLVPDPETLIMAFQREFDALCKTAQKKYARRNKATRPLIKTVDQAIGAVNKALGKSGKPAVTRKKKPSACQAKTRAGQPCKNRPLPGSDLCRIHQK